MKVNSINTNINNNQLSGKNLYLKKDVNHDRNTHFTGGLSKTKDSKIIDWILKNKLSQKLFELADKNPFAFTIASLATTCMLMRPPTILIMPGSNDKDKKYAAGKSFIASFVGNSSRILFILPLGFAMKKLGDKAEKNLLKNNQPIKALPKKFPPRSTKQFEVFNFAVSQTAGFLLAIPSSALMVYATAKIMDKLMNKTKNNRVEEVKNEN